MLERLDQPLPHASEPDLDAAHPEPKSTTAPEAYMAKVKRAKDYIAAGDIFQVVLSQRFEAPFTLPSFALYRALRRVNPSPFLYYLNFGGFAVVGSSPEILVQGPRRQSHHQADRRHAAARRQARKKTRRSPRSCSPTPRSAPSI